MKAKPEKWKDMRREDKIKFIMSKHTGVCWCNTSLGESCKKCKDMPDIREEDRNYHEEILLVLKYMVEETCKPEGYYMFETLISLDDVETFNSEIRQNFVENLKAGEDGFDNAFCAYHKTLRQCEYYNHLAILNTKTNERDDAHCFQSILYNLIHMSEIPYNVIKRLMAL